MDRVRRLDRDRRCSEKSASAIDAAASILARGIMRLRDRSRRLRHRDDVSVSVAPAASLSSVPAAESALPPP